MFAILKAPTAFFAQFPFESKNTQTLLVGTACLCFGIFAESGTQILISDFASHFKALTDLIPAHQLELVRKEAFLSLIASPLVAFFGIYLFAGALHLSLRAFSTQANLRYETTLHLVSLSQIPMILSAVPLFGPIVASVWVFVLLMKGLTQIYSLSKLAAFVCILLPALFLKLSWNSALQLLALSV